MRADARGIICAAGLSLSLLAGSFRAESTEGLPPWLSQTSLYDDIANKRVAPHNRPFVPQYPLWSDGAKKSRWIYLPPESVIHTENPNRWRFPVGTVFWKEFRHQGRRVETRIMKKVAPDPSIESWVMGAYQWRRDESDASLVEPTGVTDAAATKFPEVTHDIPSKEDCTFCHDRGGDPILGFDALQLSTRRDPPAPHREPLTDEHLTLADLMEQSRLSHPPREQPWVRARSRSARAAIGYLHGNCGSCHNPKGAAAATGWFTRYDLHADAPPEVPAVASGVNELTQFFEVPGRTLGVDSFRLEGGSPKTSAVFFRMSRRDPQLQMPPIATKVQDRAALALLEQWIEQLSAP